MKDELLKILDKLNLKFTDEEITKLLEEDICMEERPITDYIILKNVHKALLEKDKKEQLLSNNLSESMYTNVLNVFNENI